MLRRLLLIVIHVSGESLGLDTPVVISSGKLSILDDEVAGGSRSEMSLHLRSSHKEGKG